MLGAHANRRNFGVVAGQNCARRRRFAGRRVLADYCRVRVAEVPKDDCAIV